MGILCLDKSDGVLFMGPEHSKGKDASRCTEISLPGLDESDGITLMAPEQAKSKDDPCPLTCYPMNGFNPNEFLQDIVSAIVRESEGDNKKRSRSLADLQDKVAGATPHAAVARLQGCGHEFQALPLLFHVLTSKFRCPVCRVGSSKTVDLSCDKKFAQALPMIDKGTCSVLCQTARLSRENKKIEDMREEMTALLEMHMVENSRLEDMSTEELMSELRVYAVFTFLTDTDVGVNSNGRNFHIAMHSRILVTAGSVEIKYQSGQALRALSQVLRISTSFTVTLIAESNGSCGTFFQTSALVCPENVAYVQRAQCSQGTHGLLELRWDRDPISNIVLLRGISYTTIPENIRRISLQTMGATESVG